MTGETRAIPAPAVVAADGLASARPRRRFDPLRLARRQPTMILGSVILLFMVVVALAAPVLATHNPGQLAPANRLRPPSEVNRFGTDNSGRDVFSRTVWGTQVSLIIGASVAIASSIMGALVGLVAGSFRRADAILMRFMDGFMAFPGLLMALALVAFFGGSMLSVILVLTVVDTPRIARTIRSAVLSLREQPFIEAARCIGVRDHQLIFRHVAPNVVAPMIVQGTFIFASAILAEASLSFLGVGTPPTTPTWGNIIGEGRTYIRQALWLSLFPGAAIFLTVLAINLIGDGLRDVLDPRLSRRD